MIYTILRVEDRKVDLTEGRDTQDPKMKSWDVRRFLKYRVHGITDTRMLCGDQRILSAPFVIGFLGLAASSLLKGLDTHSAVQPCESPILG